MEEVRGPTLFHSITQSGKPRPWAQPLYVLQTEPPQNASRMLSGNHYADGRWHRNLGVHAVLEKLKPRNLSYCKWTSWLFPDAWSEYRSCFTPAGSVRLVRRKWSYNLIIRTTTGWRQLSWTCTALGRVILGERLPLSSMKVQSIVGLPNQSAFHW